MAGQERRFIAGVGVTPDAPIPEQELRQYLSDFSFSPQYFCANVFVFTGTGLRSAIVRSVMLGLRLMSPKPIPSTIAGSGKKAHEWILENQPDVKLPPDLPRLFDSLIDARA